MIKSSSAHSGVSLLNCCQPTWAVTTAVSNANENTAVAHFNTRFSDAGIAVCWSWLSTLNIKAVYTSILSSSAFSVIVVPLGLLQVHADGVSQRQRFANLWAVVAGTAAAEAASCPRTPNPAPGAAGAGGEAAAAFRAPGLPRAIGYMSRDDETAI